MGCGCKLFLVVLVALCLLVFYQGIGNKMDLKNYPALGHRFEIAPSHWMHLRCVGNGTTSVILEAGLPFTSLSFELLLEAAKRDAFTEQVTLCSYDRSGYGWSDSSPTAYYNRTVDTIAEELHALLKEGKIKPPYVLVGWSFGGWLIQAFAKQYPSETSSLVLVDSLVTNPLMDGKLQQGIKSFYAAMLTRWFGLFRLGALFNLLPMEAGAPSPHIPEWLQASTFATICYYPFTVTAFLELINFRQSQQLIAEINRYPNPEMKAKKLVMITASEAPDMREQEDELSRLAESYTNVGHVIAQSDHYIPYHDYRSIIEGIKLAM